MPAAIKTEGKLTYLRKAGGAWTAAETQQLASVLGRLVALNDEKKDWLVINGSHTAAELHRALNGTTLLDVQVIERDRQFGHPFRSPI